MRGLNDRSSPVQHGVNQDLDSILSQQLNSLRKQREFRNLLLRIAVAVVVVFLVTGFILGVAVIHGNAMEPALKEHDFCLVWKWGRHYAQGDIVFFKDDALSGVQVRRVIAGPGDTVRISSSTGQVQVNGEVLEEPYVYSNTVAADVPYPITLEKGEYFLLGDHRVQSMDSRYSAVGVIPQDAIIGKLLFVFRSN